MKNPFQYGPVVTGEAFCNRKEELKDLRHAIMNGERLFVYSERRLGKTSLVRSALAQLPKRSSLAAYVDLWPTDGELSFVTATAKAITEASATSTKKMLEIAKALFGRLVPTVTVGDEGKPQVEFGVPPTTTSAPELEEVLSAPAKLAANGIPAVVIVYDEFQRILDYNTDLVERRLRSIVQQQSGVSYLFLGSRKHLIRGMFLNESRPLYRSAGHYPLGPIAEVHWRPFIRSKFECAAKQIDDEGVSRLFQLTEGHPFYMQHLCHTLWELVDERAAVTEDLIDQALDLLLDREAFAYTTLWENLTKNQQRLLRGLAIEPIGVKPFASEFTRRYNLRSASNAQRAAEALVKRDVIETQNGSYVVVDRFFRLWTQRRTT